jgi:cellulose synthase/poly-beta-1,6-N-acetylglucosamine synthase-like glycosyltransferase
LVYKALGFLNKDCLVLSNTKVLHTSYKSSKGRYFYELLSNILLLLICFLKIFTFDPSTNSVGLSLRFDLANANFSGDYVYFSSHDVNSSSCWDSLTFNPLKDSSIYEALNWLICYLFVNIINLIWTIIILNIVNNLRIQNPTNKLFLLYL